MKATISRNGVVVWEAETEGSTDEGFNEVSSALGMLHNAGIDAFRTGFGLRLTMTNLRKPGSVDPRIQRMWRTNSSLVHRLNKIRFSYMALGKRNEK